MIALVRTPSWEPHEAPVDEGGAQETDEPPVRVPSLVTDMPVTLDFQTTDPATNQVTGTRDTPIDIPARGSQSLVVALTPTAPIPPVEFLLRFACGGTVAPIITGVNTLLLSASPQGTPVPDIVALALAAVDTPGVVKIPESGGTGVFVVGTTNVGATGAITASADTGTVSLPVSILLCQMDPVTSGCLAPPAPSVTTTVNAGATPSFGIFVSGGGGFPFDPAHNRIFVRFKEPSGVTRGATSVAVMSQ